MNSIHICVLTPDYPSPGRPVFPFVEQIVFAFAQQGNKVTVLAPQNVINILFRKQNPVKEIRKLTDYQGTITIYSPYTLSGYSIPHFGNIINRLSGFFLRKYMRRHRISPDYFYSHFWRGGLWTYQYAKELGKPLFVASGESTINIINNSQRIDDYCKYVKGVICVSSKNKNESIRKRLTSADKCIVIPNAIDNNLFRLMDKAAIRKKLGLGLDDFIVSFVGYFSVRKGSKRLSDAISLLNDKGIKSIFIGSSFDNECDPVCDNIIFKGTVEHKEVPIYLNCADVFVLPTLREGCANAIVEAMACGLPVISSNLDFNSDILDETCSILINPSDVNEIADAIKKLKDNAGLRKKLSDGAVQAAANLKISKRAEKIISFMKSR